MGEGIGTRERTVRGAPASTGAGRPDVDSFGAIGSVGAALVVALAALVSLVQLLGWVGLSPLALGTPGTATTLGFAAAAVLAYLWLRRRSSPRVGTDRATWTVAVPAAPALVLTMYIATSRVLPLGVRTEWYLGGDHVRHLIMVAEEQASGALSYETWAYPRAWHTLLAGMWSAAGVDPRADLAAVVDLTSVAVWLLSALLAMTIAAFAASLGDHVGLGLRRAAFAGAAAGFLTFLPAFLGNYQALGLETSLLGACVLAVVLRSQLVEPDGVRSLVIAGAGVVVVAQTWQLLLPVVALALLRSGLGLWRRYGHRGAVLAVALSLVALVVTIPSYAALLRRFGVQHATAAGVVVPVPWTILVLGAVAGALLALRLSWSGRWVAALGAVPAVTGFALAAKVGVTPSTYYPSKLLWNSAVLGLAPLTVGAVLLAGLVLQDGSTRARAARAAFGTIAALGLLFVLAQPVGAFTGVWSTAHGPTLLRLLDTPDAGKAQVVWSGRGPSTDTLSRLFLDAIRADPGPLRTPQNALTVEEECELLAEAEDPAVLSNQPVSEVRERYACVPSLRVILAGSSTGP